MRGQLCRKSLRKPSSTAARTTQERQGARPFFYGTFLGFIGFRVLKASGSGSFGLVFGKGLQVQVDGPKLSLPRLLLWGCPSPLDA